MSDNNPFLMECSAKQNAEVLGSLYTRFDMERFLTAMKKMEVQTGKAVGAMSRGEQMRFQMAFAMAHGTKLCPLLFGLAFIYSGR